MNANHVRRYRPLLAGIEIFNPKAGDSGTLGLIAEDAAGDKWLVSCFHVLCGANGTAADDEPIYQGVLAPGTEVARTAIAKSNAALDVAAGRLLVAADCAALGIGRLAGIGAPKVGTRVLKSGATTGVTEGIISRVEATRVTIEIPESFPLTYDMTERGDSGAPWIEAETRLVVGLHTSGTAQGVDKAFAVPAALVLSTLALTGLSS